MKLITTILITVFTALPLAGQIGISGNIHPSGLFGLSDGKEISLPIRLATLTASYTYHDLEFVASSSLEYRWKHNQTRAELREAYLVWYPPFGEVSVGKQIFAWGMADANNPTDNLSAYDYYYLFDNGTERKIGSPAASVKWYLANWQIQAVFIPYHEPNRMVYEEDFPIKPPMHPSSSQIQKVKNEQEYGARIQTSFGNSDLAVSYFQGHDRLFSPNVFIPTLKPGNPYLPINFAYRKTDAYGADMVNFWNDFTFRNEAAYFVTGPDWAMLYDEFINANFVDISAEYLQYVSQIEYTGFENFTLTTQIIGNHVYSVETSPPGFEASFSQGMGSPFASFLDQALMISLTSTLWDNRLEIKPLVMANLKNKGYMVGFEVDYSPTESINLEASLNNFIGDDSLGADYIFNQLEDFSNFRLGLKYSF